MNILINLPLPTPINFQIGLETTHIEGFQDFDTLRPYLTDFHHSTLYTCLSYISPYKPLVGFLSQCRDKDRIVILMAFIEAHMEAQKTTVESLGEEGYAGKGTYILLVL